MPHDIQLTEPANIRQAELLFEALRELFVDEGEPWQQQEREARLKELEVRILGEK